MIDDILNSLPVRRGHFLLESGYHTDIWFDLDALFLTPREVAPQVAALAELLRPCEITAVCGPLFGGAFLAHALAAQMGLRFYYAQQMPAETAGGLYTARYILPAELRRRVVDERIAIVDDCISAGSSVRATAEELTAAGAHVLAVGAIMLLGNRAVEHFKAQGIPVVALAHQEFKLWTPAECPLCRTGARLENPAISV